MPHRHPHKPVHHVKPNYKRLALIAAAAAMLSTTTLPGMAAPTVHAAANSNANTLSATTSQQVGKTTDSSSQINLQENFTPNHQRTKKENKSSQANKKPSKTANTKTPTREISGKKNNPPQPTKPARQETTTTEKTPQQPTEKNKPQKPLDNTTSSPPATPQPPKEESPAPPNNAPHHYQEALDISATAYAPGPHDNEQWGNKTYTGTQVRPGIIAVDPKLIPLGSRVYIEYPDGHGEYATAEDTGGAIKGNRIDIAKQTVNEAEDFGIQKVKVYVVNTPKNT